MKNKNNNNSFIKISDKEFNRLLNQAMILESVISNIEKNNFKIEDSDVIRNYYSTIKNNASEVVRIFSKKIVRIERINKHNKQ